VAKKFGVKLKPGDNPASINAVTRELGGRVEGNHIVYSAKNQTDAARKLVEATRRAIRKGR